MTTFWNNRLWTGMGIAILCGSFIGATYSYPSLFGGGDQHIYSLMIWPSVAIGIASGWKLILVCPFLHAYVAVIFLVRSLIRPELWWDYVTFVSQLIINGIAKVFPYSLAWSIAGALLGWSSMKLYRKIR